MKYAERKVTVGVCSASFPKLTVFDTKKRTLKNYEAGTYDHPSFCVYDTNYTAIQVFVQQALPIIGRWIVRKNKKSKVKREYFRYYKRLFV